MTSLRAICIKALLILTLCATTTRAIAAVAATASAATTLAAPFPTTPGDHKLRFRTTIDGKKVDLVYILRLPKDYDKTTDPRPVIVFTHGAGECGIDCNALYVHGPLAELDRPQNKSLSDSFPFILIAPQCPPRGERWDQPAMYKAVVALTTSVLPNLRADADRVYLTGLSMGGKAAWLAGMAGPDHFAALVTMASYGDYSAEEIARLRYTGVWMIAGGTNDQYAVDMNNKMFGFLKGNVAFVRNTIVPELDHEVWGPFFSNAQFYETLLSLKRPTSTERAEWEASPPYVLRAAPAIAPTTGHHPVSFLGFVRNQPVTFGGSIFVPKSYQAQGPATPLIVYLHPYKVIGKQFQSLSLHGVDAALEQQGSESFRDQFPAVVFSPQGPAAMGTWGEPSIQKAILSEIEEVAKTLNIDKTRIYVVGDQAGAAGAWQLLAAAPQTFAAVAAIQPPAGFSLPAEQALKVKDIPAFTPSNASATSASIYQSAGLYDWLLKQKK